MTARFRYALAPVLLTREWRRDNLMRQVAAADREAASARSAWEGACAQTDAALAAWQSSCAPGAALTPELIQRHGRYAASRRAIQDQARRLWETLREKHRELQVDLQRALHAVDGLERHRDMASRDYLQAALQAQYRASDEQWIATTGKEDRQ